MRTKIPDEFPKRLSQLRELRIPGVSDLTSRVRDLVLVASSSRGGSSMLAEMFRYSPDMVHFQAELNPVLRLAKLNFPVSGDSDHLNADNLNYLSPVLRGELEADIAQDAGSMTNTVDDFEFVLAATWRLLIQWPSLDFDIPDLLEIGSRTLRHIRLSLGWEPGRIVDASIFLIALLEDLRALGADVDPYFYDLPGHSVGRSRKVSVSGGPPCDFLIEEPPFVVPRPWRRADSSDIAAKALVIKSPSNAYRMDFLRALFPNARIRVLHLTRNPAASINGLFDGWRHHGFHSHRMPEPLSIEGYGIDRPAERKWWKFDLPPGWREVTGLPLLNVCAFQWRSCHQAILADTAGIGSDYLRVRFEDLTRDPGSRTAVLARIAAWLDIPFEGAFARAASRGIAPVVATLPPSAGRWRQRREAILAAIDRDVAAVVEELGYGTDDDWV
jgi:hypothetical protein